MAFDFHKDRNKYFYLQYNNSRDYILPFIQKYKKIKSKEKVLEIGCRDGGVLKPFIDLSCECFGVDLSKKHISDAKKIYEKEIKNNQVHFFVQDIYDFINENKDKEKFDIIILKDVIEHIFDHKKLIQNNFIYFYLIKNDPSFLFLKDTKNTKITPSIFEKIIKKENFEILYRDMYFISPMYKYKFGLKPRKLWKLLENIPYLRNFFTTTCDYLIKIK
ncbi:MAG: hypothetical protein B6I24_07140 [Bacteroidetes bacterium 4572_128]|nr:MAG: hypothetical protein B6I24_07140 [Bacteroidetes bacterium 4572_128]